MTDSDGSSVLESLRHRVRHWSALLGQGWPLSRLSEWTLARNFGAMPKILKWLTALGLSVTLPLVLTMIPGNHVRAFGTNISTQEWWLSGAGWVFGFTYGLMPVSAVLMLQRSRHGPLLYVLGWLAAAASGPLVAWLLGSPVLFDLASLIFGFLWLAFVRLYLARSHAVREYFQDEVRPG